MSTAAESRVNNGRMAHHSCTVGDETLCQPPWLESGWNAWFILDVKRLHQLVQRQPAMMQSGADVSGADAGVHWPGGRTAAETVPPRAPPLRHCGS